MKAKMINFRETEKFLVRIENAANSLQCSKSDLLRNAAYDYLERIENSTQKAA